MFLQRVEETTHPKRRRICAGRWSTRRPHSTSLSSGYLYGNPSRSRSSLSPGCSRGRLSERVRRWQLWQPVYRTTTRTTSPTHLLPRNKPAKLATPLAQRRGGYTMLARQRVSVGASQTITAATRTMPSPGGKRKAAGGGGRFSWQSERDSQKTVASHAPTDPWVLVLRGHGASCAFGSPHNKTRASCPVASRTLRSQGLVTALTSNTITQSYVSK